MRNDIVGSKIFCLVLGLILSVRLNSFFPVTAAQEGDIDSLIPRIRAGDAQAITEAGKSGDKRFVPYLQKELLSSERRPSQKPVKELRLALVRLGDTQQLQ